MFFQIAPAYPAILANGFALRFVEGQIWQERIADARISPAVLFKKGYGCFQMSYLQIIFGSIVSVSFSFLYP